MDLLTCRKYIITRINELRDLKKYFEENVNSYSQYQTVENLQSEIDYYAQHQEPSFKLKSFVFLTTNPLKIIEKIKNELTNWEPDIEKCQNGLDLLCSKNNEDVFLKAFDEKVADILKKNIEALQLEEELIMSIHKFLAKDTENRKRYKPLVCFPNGIESPKAQEFTKANIYSLNERLVDVKCMLDK